MNEINNNSIDTSDIYLGMGQAKLVRREERVICFLGSCVAISLYSPYRSIGAISHVVLGHSGGRQGSAAKFADQAIGHMCELLKEHDCTVHELEAAMSGGASLLKQGGPFQIGRSNAKILEMELAQHGIPLVQRDTGGARSRRTVFDGSSGNHRTIYGEPDTGLTQLAKFKL